MLQDDLIVLGWYAEALASLVRSLMEVNAGERVGLDILIDRLPRDPDDRMAVVLKSLVTDATDGLGHVAGRPERSDFLQRDLFVDNLAGLRREIATQRWTGDPRAIDIYRVNKVVTRSELPGWQPASS